MKLPVDEQFLRERELFQLRFSCEDCENFDVGRCECAHGYPTVEHREATVRAPTFREVVFCKEFELR